MLLSHKEVSRRTVEAFWGYRSLYHHHQFYRSLMLHQTIHKLPKNTHLLGLFHAFTPGRWKKLEWKTFSTENADLYCLWHFVVTHIFPVGYYKQTHLGKLPYIIMNVYHPVINIIIINVIVMEATKRMLDTSYFK